MNIFTLLKPSGFQESEGYAQRHHHLSAFPFLKVSPSFLLMGKMAAAILKRHIQVREQPEKEKTQRLLLFDIREEKNKISQKPLLVNFCFSRIIDVLIYKQTSIDYRYCKSGMKQMKQRLGSQPHCILFCSFTCF